MDWDKEVARARQLKEEAIKAERYREEAAASVAAQEEADRHSLCEALERVRNAFVRAERPAARKHTIGFVSFSKLRRTRCNETYAEMRVSDIADIMPGYDRPLVEIVYYKYPHTDDGHLVSVASNWHSQRKQTYRIRDIKLVGTDHHLTPELVLLAAARYCGENDVELDIK